MADRTEQAWQASSLTWEEVVELFRRELDAEVVEGGE